MYNTWQSLILFRTVTKSHGRCAILSRFFFLQLHPYQSCTDPERISLALAEYSSVSMIGLPFSKLPLIPALKLFRGELFPLSKQLISHQIEIHLQACELHQGDHLHFLVNQKSNPPSPVFLRIL